jgi:hypothetical protein
MSRARDSTHVWTVADDLAQAVEDLRRDWSTQRTPAWALDAPLTDGVTLTRESVQALPPDQQAHLAALLHAETALAGDAIMGISLPDRAATLGQAEDVLARAGKPGLIWRPVAVSGRPPRRVERSGISPRPAKHANRPNGPPNTASGGETATQL